MTVQQQIENLGRDLARLNLSLKARASDPNVSTLDWYDMLLQAQATDARLRFLRGQYQSLENGLKR